MVNGITEAQTMPRFWREQAEWSQATFGLDTERGPRGPLMHLAREVLTEMLHIPREAVDEIFKLIPADCGDFSDVMEWADMQFLIFDACRRAKFTYHDLLTACFSKLEINKQRKWGPKTGDAPVEHIRD